jgi:hypothetical protein
MSYSTSSAGWLSMRRSKSTKQLQGSMSYIEAGDDETLQGYHDLGADLAPAKQPRLSAHRNRAQTAFQMVGVDG